MVIVLFGFISLLSCTQQEKVNVTYVGNAGFLFEIGDKKILIDALFKGFDGNYEMPQEVQKKLTLAQAPFDNVDLILVTHAHGDHVDSAMVREHMKNNPKAILASTQQLIDYLKDSTERCIGFNPTKEISDQKEIQGIRVKSFLLPHGPDSRIINIGFLVAVNGITLFQTGDADFDQFTFDEFKSLGLAEEKIDLAFIQHYYMRGYSIENRFIQEGIASEYVFPIHYHFTTPPFDSTIVRQYYPAAVIFKEELQAWEMPQ
jgi:L-ascorbate metabolism protein UlaG (beta-lactamase superfamily)